MKTKISLLTVLLVLMSIALVRSEEIPVAARQTQTEAMTIYCPASLEALVTTWANEYSLLHPGTEIGVKHTPAEGVPENALGFVMPEMATMNVNGWNMVVGRAIVVPVVNAGNPAFIELLAKGLSAEKMAMAFKKAGSMTWGELLGTENRNPVNLLTSTDPLVIESVSGFLGMPVSGTGTEEEVAARIAADPFALGFCKLTTVAGADQKLAGNIVLAPIDKNNNGKIDYMEQIYDDAAMLARGAWIGKYPRALSRNIEAVSSSAPSAAAEAAFLKWILTKGQPYLAMNGLTSLASAELQSKLYKIDGLTAPIYEEETAWSGSGALALILLGILLAGLLVAGTMGFRKRKPENEIAAALSGQNAFDLKTVSAPKGLFYDKTHTWAFMEADGRVKIGIDDFLQQLTGAITRVEMRKPGDKITRGELLVTVIQQGKQLRLYAPVTGTIRESNPALVNDSSLINSAPFTEGWIYKVEPANWLGEISLMKMAGKYTQWLADEWVRVKDFFTNAIRSRHLEYSAIILQDGGLLKNHLLEDFGPDIWEDFQVRILDSQV